MPEPQVAVVTPIHNGCQHTLRFLRSLTASSYSNLRIVVVDDGSTDGSTAAIKKQFPQVTILREEGDLWWAGATNRGIEQALHEGANYILTINNDTTVESDAVRALVSYAEDHPKTLVGSTVCYESEPERIWYFGGFLDRDRGDVVHHQGWVRDFAEPFEPEWLTGMGALIHRSVFQEVGLLDAATFPQYFADADFSLRAKRHGFRLAVIPDSRIYTDVESTWIIKTAQRLPWRWFVDVFISLRSPYQVQARYRFYRRHWGPGSRRALVRLYGNLVRRELAPLVGVKLTATIGAYLRGGRRLWKR